MNPRFNVLLAITRRLLPDAPLQWHTNGTMLTAKRVKEILAVPYTHKIFVSLDGGNARSHDLNRGQGNFHKTMGGLRRLLERSEEHTSELQSLMRISYAVSCLKKKHK